MGKIYTTASRSEKWRSSNMTLLYFEKLSGLSNPLRGTDGKLYNNDLVVFWRENKFEYGTIERMIKRFSPKSSNIVFEVQVKLSNIDMFIRINDM